MTKIEEFENSLMANRCTEAELTEYEKLLRRVHSNYDRLQHCYTTAVQFPESRRAEAVRLIEWGLEKYPDTWFPTYSAYYDMGIINERSGEYRLAYEAYLKAADVLGEEQLSYRRTISGNLLWMLLHTYGFTYSEQLEKYYDLFSETDDFEKSFINNEFRLAIAEIIIFSHRGAKDKGALSYKKALELTKPNAVSRIQGLLNKHRYKDTLKITPECASFLKSAHTLIN